MKMSQFTFKDQIGSFEDYMDTYLKNKSTDCILYSYDGGKFKVHKELFGQTQFLRKILSSTKDHCCGTIEVICPCSKEELGHLVNFLYDGEIHCKEESESLKIIENLQKIFGFHRNLDLIYPNTSDNNVEVFENILDNSDVQEIVIIPVKDEPFDQGEDIYTNQGENDNDFDSHESENDLQVERSKCYNRNDDLGNTRNVDIDFKNGSKFEHGGDEIENLATLVLTDAEKSSKTRNVQKKSKCDEIFENIMDDPNAEKIGIIPPSNRDMSGGKLVANDQCKEDYVFQNCEKNVSGKKKKSKKISGKKVKESLSCQYCGKSFVSKQSVKMHIDAIHFQLRPFSCDYCEETFTQKSNLRTHVKNKH